MIGCVGVAIDAYLVHPARQILGHENEIAGERLRPLLAVKYADGRCMRPIWAHVYDSTLVYARTNNQGRSEQVNKSCSLKW